MRKEHLRILVVDDSVVVCNFLKHILHSDKNIEVAGMAKDGREAIRMARELNPDLITMDINMPVMDGFTATEKIMQETPVPVVIVSGLYSTSDVKMTFEALNAGAVNILPKPAGIGSPDFKESKLKFLQMIWLMSEIKVVRRYGSKSIDQTTVNKKYPHSSKGNTKLVCIGASAGGPLVIQKILNDLPKPIPFPIIIVQHVDAGFADGFVSWLKESTGQYVKVATHGEQIENGVIYLAPGDHHIGLRSKDSLSVSKTNPVNGCRPSVSYLFNSVLVQNPKCTTNILLSGMGRDGAYELKMLKEAGAVTIAQNKETSLVYGMPGEAVNLGGATMVLPPEEITAHLKSLY